MACHDGLMDTVAELVPVLPAHRFDEDALLGYLRPRLPGLDGELQIRQFQGGQSNPTFHIKGAGHEFVLRKKPPGKLLPRAHDVQREHRVMSALAGTEVPVPPTRLFCSDDSVIGTAFFVMDYVPGRVFADPLMPGSTTAERAAVYQDLARVLAALHRVDWRAVGLDGFGRPDGYLQRQVERWTRQWEAARVEEMPAMDCLAAWLPEHLPLDDETACIAHGDYRLGNVLIHPTEPRVVAVLDWELSTIGHPLADLGYACLGYHVPGGLAGHPPMAHLTGTGIPDQQTFVDSYCTHAGREVPESLDLFVVFSMFRLASIGAGVYRRGLEGNASDPRAASAFGDRYRQLAEQAWALAQRL